VNQSDIRSNSVARQRFSKLSQHLSANLIGRESLIERLLIALLARGHVLIEGVPGLAKTRAVRSMAEALAVDFVRIQATPDLLPADITGTTIYRPQTGQFDFSPGPLFSNIVLVDEINRAPAKAQSALLEAMGEKQITIAGTTRKLEDPFMVIATQNPIEHEGTYPLPEAQLDRFIFLVNVELPDADEEMRILNLVETEIQQAGAEPTSRPLLERDDIASARNEVAKIHLSNAVRHYIVRLVTATRGMHSGGNSDTQHDLTSFIEHASSPRGSLALASGARARAWLHGRDYVLPEDVSDLAIDALNGRIVLSYKSRAEGMTARRLIAELVDHIAVV